VSRVRPDRYNLGYRSPGAEPILSVAALYPGTFDPVTRGHEDLVRRAARVFDRIVVAVAASPKKSPLLPLDERMRLVRAVLDDLPQVEVAGYDGLTVEFARANGLAVIVRGARSGSDFEVESQLAAMNSQLDDAVETVVLPPSPALAFVSATLIREIASLGGDVSTFVQPLVADRLRAALAAPR
jgi:pantetheine-phosphate adenylyltransferase